MIDISKITDYLYIGSFIGHQHSEDLKVFKFDLIISMIAQSKPHEIYTKPPFKTIWIRTYDTFFTPITIKKFMVGVESALPVIKKGGKVLVFCMQGKRRSVSMACAILIASGLPADDAAKLVIAGRKIADPYRWYVKRQVSAFEKFWHRKHPQTKAVL